MQKKCGNRKLGNLGSFSSPLSNPCIIWHTAKIQNYLDMSYLAFCRKLRNGNKVYKILINCNNLIKSLLHEQNM